jgi:hypothetical protein
MRIRKGLITAGVATIVATWLAVGGVAAAAFPNFSDCPRSTTGVTGCVDIQSLRGSLEIKGFTVPLGNSLEIRGGLVSSSEVPTFVPPAGTNGFFSRPVNIPGGLLGIDFPIPGNAVTGTAQLAGPASAIRLSIGFEESTVSVPVKLKLDNPILGSHCFIGTNSNPVHINLTTGTTSPPPPNRPISGDLGTVSFEGNVVKTSGSVSVDNSFSIPGASGCGIGLGLVNALVNAKLKLPSAGGNNAMIVENDVAIELFG